jgi:hypothetical protein
VSLLSLEVLQIKILKPVETHGVLQNIGTSLPEKVPGKQKTLTRSEGVPDATQKRILQ